jgi:hypothetical protein
MRFALIFNGMAIALNIDVYLFLKILSI